MPQTGTMSRKSHSICYIQEISSMFQTEFPHFLFFMSIPYDPMFIIIVA